MSSNSSAMAREGIPSSQLGQSVSTAGSTSDSEKPPLKRLRSSRSVASATAGAISYPTVYRHLDHTKREIRICDLSCSSELSAPLICSLRVAPLDKVGKFVALSYVWGQEPPTETITINGFKRQIRPNLASGLRRLRAFYSQSSSGNRRKPRPISVWADAICINQDSIEERNHQVQLMRSIFSKCEFTFSWLGESDNTSDLAMDSIARLAAFKYLASRDPFLPHVLSTQGGSHFCEAAPWIAIRKLLEREFWHRIWIFQEIILPERLVLACGSKHLCWCDFSVLNALRVDIIYRRNDHRLLRRELTRLNGGIQDEVIAVCEIIQDLFLMFVYDSSWDIDISGCIVSTLHLKATDARDKIYGLLGLEKDPMMLPDYSKTVNQSYTEFATLLLYTDLTYLQCGGLAASGNDTELASWVPNWDHITRTMATAAASRRLYLLPGICSESCFSHLRHVEFHVLPHLTALHVRGQLRSSIVSTKSKDEWLEVHNYKKTINDLYGSLYTCWSEGAVKLKNVRQPVPRLVALYLTLTQSDFMSRNCDLTEWMELAAGFCYTTFSRLNSTIDNTDTMSTPSLSMLLETLGSIFENHPGTFSHPEQYEKEYLAAERESLHRRVFFETSSGRFGLGPIGAREGDIVCNIYDLDIPLLLRKVDSHYLIVGTCSVLGCMADQGCDASKAEILEIW